MLPLRSIFSALVVAAYLSAAFVPCEPALVFVDWTSGDTAHPAAATPASSPHSHSTARAPAGRAPSHSSHQRSAYASTSSQAHAESAGHGHEHGSPAQRQAEVDPSSGTIADEAGSVAPSPRAAAFCELELKPTCLCGCSESRATVGGSVSRLGAAVPAVYVGRFVEVRTPAALDLVRAHARAGAPDQDPIPI